MSQLNTQPVTSCRYCGKTLVLTHHETMFPDPSGEHLEKLTRMILENATCNRCSKAKAYYEEVGRPEDFWRNEWQRAPITKRVLIPVRV